MIECLPHTLLDVPSAPYGRYEVVLAGSVIVSGHRLLPVAFRYVHHDQEVAPVEGRPGWCHVDTFGFRSRRA
jgi:hypothetical protein